jgi:beta-glucosidase
MQKKSIKNSLLILKFFLTITLTSFASDWAKIDDFQNHPPGPLPTEIGWNVLSSSATRASVNDDRNNPGNQAIKIQHIEKKEKGEHDIFYHNQAVNIQPGKTGSVFLRFMIENGLDELGNTNGSEPVESVSLKFVCGESKLHAGNPVAGINIIGKNASILDFFTKGLDGKFQIKRNRWYKLWIIIDNRASATDSRSAVMIQEEGSKETPVKLHGAILKPDANVILSSIGLIKSHSCPRTDLWVDDFFVDNNGENFTDPTLGKSRSWQQLVAEEAAKYKEFTRTAATWDVARQQAQKLMEAMTPSERFALVCGDGSAGTPAFPRLGIKAVQFSDASAGINNGAPGGSRRDRFPKTVAHPALNLLAATWDPQIAQEYAKSIGEECRSGGIQVLLGPGMNMYRASICGRNFEYVGEDPWLASQIIAAYVKGIQSTGTASTLKHFIGNEIEAHRRATNSIIDERTLHEIYLPPFKAGIEAGSLTLMSAYNQLNGEWAGESRYLNTTILRDELKFQGISMTDWIATYDGLKLASSGTDLEMPGGWALLKSRSTLLGSKEIDGMALRVLTTWIKAGFFEESWTKPGLEKNRPLWEQSARKTNLEGITLLSNNGILPFADRFHGKTILITGNNAQRTELSGGGSGHVYGYNLKTYLQAFQEAFPQATVVAVDAPSSDQIKSADLILIVAGFLQNAKKDQIGQAESEGRDRSFLLPDDSLINTCVATNPRTVVILTSGGGVSMDWAEKAAATLFASYGGQTGANALLEILTGAAEPSGRLPFTIETKFEDSPAKSVLEMNPDPSRSWAADISGMAKGDFFVDPTTKQLQVTNVRYDEGVFVGYRWYQSKKIPVRFPFGHGLSYTTFEYKDLQLEKSGDHSVRCSFTLVNTGKFKGAEVAQIYVSDPQCSVPRPPQELKGFKKIRLAAGEKKRVEIELGAEAFRFWHPEKKAWTIEPGEFEIRVGASSGDIRMKQSIEWSPKK